MCVSSFLHISLVDYICILGWVWGIFYRKVLFRKYSSFVSLLVHFFTFNKTVLFLVWHCFWYIYVICCVKAIGNHFDLRFVCFGSFQDGAMLHGSIIGGSSVNGLEMEHGEKEVRMRIWSRDLVLNWDWFDFVSVLLRRHPFVNRKLSRELGHKVFFHTYFRREQKP